LGLAAEKLKKLKQVASLPHGMILVCGPTGSGKTSTLYSILKHINTPEKNIVTVEDPVEFHLQGINQVSVNTKTGLSFSRTLRSILRQDPDIIMIGEIRDFETVDIAIKAALTGHLVLSTLHTTTAAGSLVRLIDMGVEPFLINASLICIIAQRLSRKICAYCKEESGEHRFRGRGCKECLNTGYSGRVLISEILYLSPEIKENISSRRLEENNIKKLAMAQGMRSLRQEGMDLVSQGLTTLEEILRVTPPD
jgi:type IV pilus assembly protein PilB